MALARLWRSTIAARSRLKARQLEEGARQRRRCERPGGASREARRLSNVLGDGQLLEVGFREIVTERLRERGQDLAGRVGKGELKVEDAQKQIEEYDQSLEGEVTDLGKTAAAALAGAQPHQPVTAGEKNKEPAAQEGAGGGHKDAPAGEEAERKKHVDEMLSAARLKDGDASWGQAGSIKDEKLTHPAFQGGEKKGGFAGNFKCNIFVGEFLYRSGFMTAGSDEKHEPTVKYTDVNGMCDDIEAVAKGGKPLHGAQWFDVVKDPEHNAQPGDVVIVRGKYRQDGHGGMHVNSKSGMKEEGHGHIELLSDVIRDEGTGQLREVTAIGAGSAMAHEHQMSRARRSTTWRRNTLSSTRTFGFFVLGFVSLGLTSASVAEEIAPKLGIDPSHRMDQGGRRSEIGHGPRRQLPRAERMLRADQPRGMQHGR